MLEVEGRDRERGVGGVVWAKQKKISVSVIPV